MIKMPGLYNTTDVVMKRGTNAPNTAPEWIDHNDNDPSGSTEPVTFRIGQKAPPNTAHKAAGSGVIIDLPEPFTLEEPFEVA
ncbi:MAG: hypothetical protein AAFY56_08875 [Pseudomonadota bacterium]